jgi:hypothetical protein
MACSVTNVRITPSSSPYTLAVHPLSYNSLYGFKAARSAPRARPGPRPGLRSCLRPAPARPAPVKSSNASSRIPAATRAAAIRCPTLESAPAAVTR